jgi:hypothetical protein
MLLFGQLIKEAIGMHFSTKISIHINTNGFKEVLELLPFIFYMCKRCHIS